MELRKVMELQHKFDKSHSGKFDWASKITEKNIDVLALLLICIMGELGEFSNIVKKVSRGDFSLESARNQLEDELADIFIYLIKICN